MQGQESRLGAEGRGKGRGDNGTHLPCYIAVEIDEKVFSNSSKVLGEEAPCEIWCAS